MIAIKYIFYFNLYILGGIKSNSATIIAIGNDSLMFYVQDVGYVAWKIDEKLQEDYRVERYDPYNHARFFKGKYILSHKDIKGLIAMTEFKADITIIGDGFAYHIFLKKRKRRR